jgi:hypothetical protein
VLPDGIVSCQKSKFGQTLEGLGMEDVSIFYGHFVYLCYGQMVYFMAIWSSFGIFFPFGMLYRENSGNPDQMSL